jgi:hypothetical protein
MAELSALHDAEQNRHLTIQFRPSQGLPPTDEDGTELDEGVKTGEMDDAPSVLSYS